jgi:hypothetical protein
MTEESSSRRRMRLWQTKRSLRGKDKSKRLTVSMEILARIYIYYISLMRKNWTEDVRGTLCRKTKYYRPS